MSNYYKIYLSEKPVITTIKVTPSIASVIGCNLEDAYFAYGV